MKHILLSLALLCGALSAQFVRVIDGSSGSIDNLAATNGIIVVVHDGSKPLEFVEVTVNYWEMVEGILTPAATDVLVWLDENGDGTEMFYPGWLWQDNPWWPDVWPTGGPSGLPGVGELEVIG